MGAPCLLEIEFLLSPEKRREFAQSLELFGGDDDPTRNRNCLLEDRTEPDHLLWISKWFDLHELERYTERDQFRALMGGLRLLTTIVDCRIVTLNAANELPPARYSVFDAESRAEPESPGEPCCS